MGVVKVFAAKSFIECRSATLFIGETYGQLELASPVFFHEKFKSYPLLI